MISLIAEFLFKLCTGEVWRVFQDFKTYEAKNAQNKDASLADADVAKRLSEYTRK